MLQSSDGSQRITTAKLAASVGVSEAALYRHFPSKTRMFDSLIEFIEDSLITRINLILQDEKDTLNRIRLILLLILGFAERNPGLTRIMTGHALMLNRTVCRAASTNFSSGLKRNCVRYCGKRKCVKAADSSAMKLYSPASYWHFAKGCCHVLYALNSSTNRLRTSIPAGHLSLLSCNKRAGTNVKSKKGRKALFFILWLNHFPIFIQHRGQ